MRLATWNCCGTFDTKLPHLLGCGVDVAVVCEAVTPASWPTGPGGRSLTGLGRRVWSESWKELAVVAAAPWSAGLHDAADSAPAWTLPVRIDGPVPFTLVGLWPVAFPGAPGYVGQIERAVDWIEGAQLDGPVVLAGDFNAPIASTQPQYERLVDRLERLGLVDAYRLSRGATAGQPLADATYYHHRRPGSPFHIDHVVLPAGWAADATVEVGDFDTWVGSGRSDHVPVIVDLPTRAMS